MRPGRRRAASTFVTISCGMCHLVYGHVCHSPDMRGIDGITLDFNALWSAVGAHGCRFKK